MLRHLHGKTPGSSMIGNFLLWLRPRIKYWAKPANPALISGLLTCLTRSRNDLLEENALLRQQLIMATIPCRDVTTLEHPFEAREREQHMAAACTQLGEEAFKRLWVEGGTMRVEGAIEYALGDTRE